MLILTVNGLKVWGLVLAQGAVSRLTVNNPNYVTSFCLINNISTITSPSLKGRGRLTGGGI